MGAASSMKLHFFWPSAALLVVALSCGGSTDSHATTGASGGSGGSGAGASGGTGGSGGDTGGSGGIGGSSTGGTGAGGTGGSGGSGGGQPDGGDVVCGGMICPATTLGTTTIPACCTTQNTCGISVGQCFDPSTFDAGGARPDTGSTGVPDLNCASVITTIGLRLSGCCRTDNTCGFSSPISACISYDTLRSLNFPGVNLPDGGPMSCVYPPM
jgi:hypothetical protein